MQRAKNVQETFAWMESMGSPPQVFRLDDPTAEARACAGCQATDKPLQKCAACSAVLYCGRECQRAHWRQHKQHCRQARERVESEREGTC